MIKRTVVLATVVLAVGCGSNLETASRERSEIRHSGRQTARSAERTVESSGSAIGRVGAAAVDATQSAGNAVLYGAREVGQEMSGTDGNPRAEATADRALDRMQHQGRDSGRDMRRAGRHTGRAVGAAAQTTVNAGGTVVQTAEHGGGAVRRATGEQPSSRGGGPAR